MIKAQPSQQKPAGNRFCINNGHHSRRQALEFSRQQNKLANHGKNRVLGSKTGHWVIA